jgi:hypothetical protein
VPILGRSGIAGIRALVYELPFQWRKVREAPETGLHLRETGTVSSQRPAEEDPLGRAPYGSVYLVQPEPVQLYRFVVLQEPPPAVHMSAEPSTTGSAIGSPRVPGAAAQRRPSHVNALFAELNSQTSPGPDAAAAAGLRWLPGTFIICHRLPFQCSRNSPGDLSGPDRIADRPCLIAARRDQEMDAQTDRFLRANWQSAGGRLPSADHDGSCSDWNSASSDDMSLPIST